MQENSTPADSALGENLIFVVSQPRAGSTMLQRILGAHPDIHTLSEPWIALHPLLALREDGYAPSFDLSISRNATKEFLQQLPEGDEAYCEGLRRMLNYLYGRALQLSGKSIFLDKTPRYFLIILELLRVFPRARFVFLIRNPLAVLISILETWCNTNPSVELSYSRNDLMIAPQLILNGIQHAGNRAIVTRYEELVASPASAVQQLCDSLGIAFYPAMIEYGTAPANQERWTYGDQGTVYRESAPVKERAERWREVLNQKPEWAVWARGYLTSLGQQVVTDLGYDYQELCAILPAGEESSWPTLMKPSHDAVLDHLRQDLLSRTTTLEELSALLDERTAVLEATTQDRKSCTAELIALRGLLGQRTDALNRAAGDLQSRTAELVAVRRLLAERTEALNRSAQDLQSRTADLVAVRRLLAERSEALNRSAQDLQSRTADLVAVRRLLADRTEALNRSAQDLQSRTADLVTARRLLADRTEALEALATGLQSRRSELIECRRLLVERGEAFDAAGADLISRTAELIEERRLLRERTEALDTTAHDLETRTAELIEARRLLSEQANPSPDSAAPSQEPPPN
ncbi:MAG: sulfotransferase [Bryobacteraceae bacterium]